MNCSKVFGSLAYRHVLGQLRKKMDDKGELIILVGYHSTGAYKLYDVVNRRTVIIRDVAVDEIKELQQPATSYQKVVTSYNNEETVHIVLDNAKTPPIEVQMEENVRIPIRQKGFPPILQDCDLFRDNEVNDDDDDGFFNFSLMAESQPVKTEEVLSVPKWICAMKEELEAIEKNKTWELVDLPDRKNLIGVRCVFKVKASPKGGIIKHKTRLIAKGLLQREGIRFEKVLAPVARIETIRLGRGIANNNNWSIYQMDVKYAFLNRPPEYEVYLEHPPWVCSEKPRVKVLQIE